MAHIASIAPTLDGDGELEIGITTWDGPVDVYITEDHLRRMAAVFGFVLTPAPVEE